MEDSSDEKVKHEKQEEILCICFLVSMYNMCNLRIELFLYILLLKLAISAILP